MTKPLFSLLFAGAVAAMGGAAIGHAAPRPANTSASHAQALHFARGAYKLSVTGNLNQNNRFYTLKVNAGQHLKISAHSAGTPDSYVVPLIFVTPPCGKYNGDKTFSYSEDSSRAGTYRIKVGANSMASRATSGNFVLNVEAR